MAQLKINADDLYEYFGLIGGSSIGFSSDICPSTYLEYAIEDLKNAEGNRCYINAVANAKRAFHYQIESISDAFSIQLVQKRKGIVDRMKFLQECGIISPNILMKLNKTRNKIEHEYYTPTLEEVQDYVDIVELFLHATNMLVRSFPTCMGLDLMEDESYDVSKNLPKHLEAKVFERKGEIIISSYGFEEIKITAKDNDYCKWVKGLVWQYFS